MKIERLLQPNHSDYMRIIAQFVDEESARQVHDGLVRYLEEIFSRADRFSCAALYRRFDSEESFQQWKATEWNPGADERATLEVERKDDGSIYVTGDSNLILDDWCRDDVGLALECNAVALRTYTAGYGVDYLVQWFSERGGDVNVEGEGYEYEFLPFEKALEQVQGASDTDRTDRVRAEDSDSDPS